MTVGDTREIAAKPARPYTVAEGIEEARRLIAICATEPEGGTLDLGGLSLDDDALAELTPASTIMHIDAVLVMSSDGAR